MVGGVGGVLYILSGFESPENHTVSDTVCTYMGDKEVAVTNQCTVVTGSVAVPLYLIAVSMSLVSNWYPSIVAFVMSVTVAVLMAGISYSSRYEVVDCA